MKEYFLNNEISYRVNEFKQDRTTLVFVHGIPGSLSHWARYEEKFEKEYNVLTYDIRGHGKSKRFREYDDYKIEKFTEDLYDLVEYLKIKKFILIGHSFGVFIAFDFISKYKNRINGLVLLSPTFNGKEIPSIKNFGTLLNIISKIKFPISQSKTRKRVNYKKSIHGITRLKLSLEEIYNTGFQIYLYCIKQLRSLDYENILNKISVPVLIMSGEKDITISTEYAKIMAQKIPNAKIIIFKNGDHIIALNKFKEVSEAIENFVKEIK